MTAHSRGCRRSERGSLPLALLAVIVVAGILVVLVVRIIGTQNLVRFDQGFHASLPVADAGVNLGKFWLNNGTLLQATGDDLACDDGFYTPSDFPLGCSTPPETRDIDGRPYTFFLTRLSDREWEVDSTGVDARSEVERRVIGTIHEIPLINVALFADTILNFAGGNAADSYSSTPSVPAAEAWCRGHGFIASNGVVDLNGVQGGPCHNLHGLKRTVDQVHLHNVDENPVHNATPERPGGDRCKHSGGGADSANCREVSAASPTYLAPDLFDEPLKYTKQAEKAFIDNALKACEADTDYEVEPWKSSENGAVLQEGTFDPGDQSLWDGEDQFRFPGDVEDYDVGFHCFDEMIFDQDTLIDAAPDEPVIVVVGSGGITIEGHVHVGCENVAGVATKCVAGSPGSTTASRPAASRLWIFTNGDITIKQQGAFAGVIWAPNAVCSGGAQVHIFGSLICDDAGNVGGWRFHYDDALAEVSSGEFYGSTWREEPRD